MSRLEVPYTRFLPQTINAAADRGILLVTQGRQGMPNAMTIGWVTAGVIWGLPIMTVLVRPSRFTYGLLNEADEFSVNVMGTDMLNAVDFCGRTSGRDRNKFSECNMLPLPCDRVSVPIIAESVVAYECRVLYANHLPDNVLEKRITDRYYPTGDFHKVYYGEILGCTALTDAAERLQAWA